MNLVFAIIAVVTIAAAVAAMSLRNLVHCALALAVAFAGIAAAYLQLGAQFVGFTQLLVYVGAVAIFAELGVWLMMLTPRSLALVLIMGPLAALLGLQLAVCASSRVNDPRSAQQLGALIIVLPIAALQIAQFIGGVVLTTGMMLALALLLCGANAVLMSIAIRLFDRESILTRWK